MGKTSIAWTDFTFNPWIGCTRVSAGCAKCYAESFVSGRMGLKRWGPNAPRVRTKQPWKEIHRWNRDAIAVGRRARVFCGSLCDVFEDHPEANAIRPDLWPLIRATPALDWQLLTKRPANIDIMLPADWHIAAYPNVWLGTSIEDMRVAKRADHLRQIPAMVRFVSYEPALGPIDELDLSDIHWLICGGESGSGHRGMDLQWARDAREACRRAGTAFFFKQVSGPRSGLGADALGEVLQAFPGGALHLEDVTTGGAGG